MSETTTETIPARELARRLGLNIKSVYAAAQRGEIPCRRLGRRYIFPRAAIEAWLAASGKEAKSA